MARLCYLLADFGVSCVFQTACFIYCDIKGALHIAAKLIFHEQTRNHEIDCHVVREKPSLGLVKLLSLSSANQIADHFTKALAPQPFFHLIAKLVLVNIYQSSICGMLLQDK